MSSRIHGAVALLFLLACAVPGRGPAPGPSGGGRTPALRDPDSTPRAVLARFVGAVGAEEWGDAYALLSARWRGRLTPARLASDYASSGSVGRAAADRVRALLSGGAPLVIREGTAVLEVGEARAAVLLLEGGCWRLDALE